MAHRPIALSLLGALQFAGFGIACVLLLSDGTLDGELSAGDIALAVGAALVGALVVGSTWSGGRLGWWFELALALGAIGWGAATAASDDPPGYPMAAAGVLSLGIIVLPHCRAWFLRPVQ